MRRVERADGMGVRLWRETTTDSAAKGRGRERGECVGNETCDVAK